MDYSVKSKYTSCLKEVIINGIDKKSLKLLKAYSRGKAPGNFIEVMACEGGCLSGPCAVADDRKSKKYFERSLEEVDSETPVKV